MSSANEILDGNPYGLGCITPKDVRKMKQRVLSNDFSQNGDKPVKEPLISKITKHLRKTIAKEKIRD